MYVHLCVGAHRCMHAYGGQRTTSTVACLMRWFLCVSLAALRVTGPELTEFHLFLPPSAEIIGIGICHHTWLGCHSVGTVDVVFCSLKQGLSLAGNSSRSPKDLPVSASPLLGLQTCLTTSGTREDSKDQAQVIMCPRQNIYRLRSLDIPSQIN